MAEQDTQTGGVTEEDLIPIETPLDDKPVVEAPEDDEDEGDARLATSDDDHEDAVTSASNIRRKKRRELQKRAKEAAQRELVELRQVVAHLSQRVAATEGHAVQSTVSTLEQRLARAQAEIQQAEHIIARATEAGNGDDAVAAMRIRDEARDEAMRLQQARQQIAQQTQQRPAAAPAADPRVATYAQEWVKANPWYDPKGADPDSAIAKQIDNELAAEGFNPADITYWQELTNRVAEAINDEPPAKAGDTKRKGPPVGGQREHAPVSSRKEIYVTPERKQAMIEAGAWDDPVKRQRMLKAYQAYDTQPAR